LLLQRFVIAVACCELAHFRHVLVEHRTHRLLAQPPQHILGQRTHAQPAGHRYADLGRFGVEGLGDTLRQVGIAAQLLLQLHAIAGAHVVE